MITSKLRLITARSSFTSAHSRGPHLDDWDLHQPDAVVGVELHLDCWAGAGAATGSRLQCGWVGRKRE